MSAIRAEGLSFAYGHRRVLDAITLSVAPGDMAAVVGPNGAGKSTLLRCLAGLLRGEGHITYAGTPLASLNARARARRRSFVPQQVGAPFPYTVGEVIAMGLAHESRFFSPPAAGERLAQAAAAVGFGGPMSRRFDHLSGGEQQQVLIARALVGRANLLLLDEPTSNLDLLHRALVIKALKERVRAGATAVLAMHDLNLAALSCDHLFLLSAGRLRAEGTPAAVLRPDLLREVYGVWVVCGVHTFAGVPTVELDPRVWS